MNDNAKIAQNTIALFARMCIIAILGLISSRFMLQYLGDVDFGIYNVVGGAVGLMAFFNVVLASSTNRFLMVELGKGQDGNIGKVFSTSLIIHVSIGIIVILLGETIGLYYMNNFLKVPQNKLFTSHIIYQISLITCSICVLQVPFQGLLISYENFTRFSIAQILAMIAIFFSSFGIGFITGNRLIYFSIFMAISQIIGLMAYFLLSKKYTPRISWKLDTTLVKRMLNFSTWISLGAAASMGKNQGSNMILNYFFGPIVNSAFSIGNQVNMQISRLSENVSKSFNPQIMKSYTSNDFDRMILLVSASCKYSFFMLYLIALPFFSKTEYILKLWLGKYPDNTVIFCNIIMINILINSLSQGIIPAVQASGKIKWFQIIGSTISLSTIPIVCISFILGAPPYFLSVAFISTAIIGLIVSYYMQKRILNFPIRRLVKAVYFRVVPVILLTVPAIWIFKKMMEDNMLGLIITFLVCIIYTTIIIYFWGLEIKERAQINNYLKNKLL